MIEVRFSHGKSALMQVRGDRFEPHVGDTFLFEFPDGAMREGTVTISAANVAPQVGATPRHALYDRTSRRLTVEM